MSAYKLGLDGQVDDIKADPQMQRAVVDAVEILKTDTGLDKDHNENEAREVDENEEYRHAASGDDDDD